MKNQDMIHENIYKSILLFSLPLLAGNLFQQLYNTVDSYVVGNYVSAYALAAVGQSTPIINTIIGFFTGLATGAGVVISQYFGAKEIKKMKDAIHTSLALTFVLCVIFTLVGITITKPILIAIGSPKEIMPLGSLYLRIYFSGITFSLIYNMGSGILRSLGDSKNPLIYLVISSIVNIVLDLVFVLCFHMGVAGVGYATVIAQAISCLLVMYQLIHTDQIYKVCIHKIRFTKQILVRIISIGIPAALQNCIVSFSNVWVQSYISKFGAVAVAGYSSTIKLDGFAQLPVQSFSMAVTTFVGQNYGAKKYDRVFKGLYAALAMACSTIALIALLLYFKGEACVGIFGGNEEVIKAGYTMILAFAPGYIFLPICHVTAGALRGVGLSKVPMFSMIFFFVIIRQLYLAIATSLRPELFTVFLAWPITWFLNSIFLTIYYYIYAKRLMEGSI